MDKVELVAKYLHGEMTPAEEHKFFADVKVDQELEQELELQQELISGLRRHKDQELKRELLEHAARKSRSRTLWYAVAASIVVVLTIGVWRQIGKSQEDLFLAYYEPYPSVFTVRGNSENPEAFEAYSDGDFGRASILFLENSKMSDTVQFYLSICSIETGDLKRAEETLLKIPSHSIFHPQRTWYLALVLLKRDKESEAKAMLMEVEKGDFKYGVAQELLEELD